MPSVEAGMARLADAVLAHRRVVVGCWALLCLVGGAFAAGLPGRIVPGGEAPVSSQSEQVARALADSPLPSLFVVVEGSEGMAPTDLERVASATADAVREVPGVTGVGPMQAPLAEEPGSERIAVLSVATSGGTDGATQVSHELADRRTTIEAGGARVFVGGFGAYRDELTELSVRDLERAERIGVPIVFVVLLLAFGSLWAAGLPLAIALTALLMGLGAVGAASFVLPMGDFVTNAATMIGIALGVDYAMFLVQRVREIAREGASVDDAVRAAMRTTGTAVLWSGVTVLAAEATLLLVDSRSIRSAAFGMVMVTLFAMVTALLVAPVLISLLGDRITQTQLRIGRGRTGASGAGWWHRWGERVTRRPVPWLVGSVALMVGLAVPAVGLGSSVNISGSTILPADAPVRQAYDLAALRHGEAALSPVLALLPPDARDRVAPATEALLADDRVAGVTPQPLDDGSVVLAIAPTSGPYEQATRDLVHDLRSGDLASAVGSDALVGGETAASVDATEAMFDSLPLVGLVLLVVVAALLLMALRSVLLPLKAVVLVVLSVGASLGALLLLTTTELGSTLIGADGPGDIHPIVPVTVIAITVALSTDYEVMLIARIAEHYRRTGDNRASVVDGVGHTGGVITGAAVIMIAVFLGFALADLAPLKQLGVGLGLAVLLDATVVRGVLVPAAMVVMGRANWWWPGRAQPSPVHSVPAAREGAGVQDRRSSLLLFRE
jgi:uncharacterized membrane protein YdfJ with MMPL/SSD domain